MALKKKSWVWQTTTTAGTGALTLAVGAATAHRTFSAAGFVDSDTAVVTFSGRTSGQKETHLCTINISGPTTTVTRNTLIASTTGAIISWNGVETVDVYLSPVPEKTRTNDEPVDLQDRVDVASASTCTIYSANSNYIRITGTTSITSLGTPTVTTGLTSMYRHVVMQGAVLLTHSASLILPNNGSNITTAAGDSFIVVNEGSGVSRVIGYQRADGTPLQAVSTVAGWTRSARTANTILGTADHRYLIDITANTFTQTFTAAATLGDKWMVEIRNSGTGDITLNPNGSETIDGLTSFVMYPGEARRIFCTGSAFFSVVLCGFNKKYTAGGTFTKPPGYQRFMVYAQGGGGGGGSGRRGAASSDKTGGTGGAGGGCGFRDLLAADIGATETITIGLGGTGATAVTADSTDGNNGNDGNASSFGTLVTGEGGPNGVGGNATAASGVTGGSAMGFSFAAANTVGSDFQGGGAANNTNAHGLAADFGGASPGRSQISLATNGGCSVRGGAGGGSGGSETAANALAAPSDGGKRGTRISTGGGGGTAGTSNASTPTAGNNATADGMGGGGGGSSQSAAASKGGNGLDGGGGGGGGSSRNGFASGAGGAGGDGSVTVIGVV